MNRVAVWWGGARGSPEGTPEREGDGSSNHLSLAGGQSAKPGSSVFGGHLKSNQQSAWAQEQQLVARTKTQISSSLRSASYYYHPEVVVAAWAARRYRRPHTPPQTKSGNIHALRFSQSA